MKKICIKNKNDGKIIYEAAHENFRNALETAIAKNISLENANLQNIDLTHANLDGGCFKNADMHGANLSEANVSEADFTNATLTYADFTNACLCESLLINTDFTGSSFSNTLIAGAVIDNCIFTCPSALMLPFIEAQIGRNIFEYQGHVSIFTTCPIVITGLPQRIILIDSMALIGYTIHPRPSRTKDLQEALNNLCCL
jgi:hypothetical protein